MLKNKSLLVVVAFIISLSAFISCQKDIPVLGQDEQGNTIIVPRDSVFISSIILNSFDSLTTSGFYWDTASSTPFDTTDHRYPDIFYNIGIYDESFPFSYYQQTYFVNVDPRNLPLTYNLIPRLYIPEFGKLFHLRVFDLDLAASGRDSVLMDSIPFVVAPDFNLTNPYINNVTSAGTNGVQVTLGLTWQ
jgi:hypothetical protein